MTIDTDGNMTPSSTCDVTESNTDGTGFSAPTYGTFNFASGITPNSILYIGIIAGKQVRKTYNVLHNQ